jgi:hypothetical protein
MSQTGCQNPARSVRSAQLAADVCGSCVLVMSAGTVPSLSNGGVFIRLPSRSTR